MSDEFHNWNVVYAYSRSQAIADGVLVDVTDAARAVGFRVHTVVTDHLFNDYVVPRPGLEGEGQSLEGRLHDLLLLALVAAKRSKGTDRVNFKVSFLMEAGKSETLDALAHIGPGDEGEPVLTLMLPEDE